jgi:hypothetical protein
MKLCFGSFMTVLKLCKPKSVTQKFLCGTVLLSVAPLYDIRNEDGTVHDLLICRSNLSPDVTDKIPTADAQETAGYFKKHVLPLLDANKMKSGILVLKDIIAKDNDIKPDVVIDRVRGRTKADILKETSFVLEEFLTGLFLYTASVVNNSDGKAFIGSIKAEYIKSFDDRSDEIALVNTSSKPTSTALTVQEGAQVYAVGAETLITISDQIAKLTAFEKPEKDMLVTLLTESRGKCLNCGNMLGIPVRGKLPSSKCEVVYLTLSSTEPLEYDNAVALCEWTCAKEVTIMSADEKKALLASKRRCAEIQAFIERTESIRFPKEIETVLREIHKVKNLGGLEKTDLKDLVEIEQKIHELYLKDKIDASMVRLYKKVKNICGRLEQEIGFDTQMFGEMMKSAQILLSSGLKNKPEITDPQEFVIELLAEKLSSQVGQQNKDACDIIIGYLVKRCDLFNENAKQS